MRCPKCGYISFDNVEKCLKCRKNISETSKEFQGSVLNVATPVFLKLTADEEDVDVALGGAEDTVDEEFDVVDPDLDILMEDEEEDSAGIQLDLEAGSGAEDEIPDLDELSGELSEIEAFTEDDAAMPEEEETAIDLGMLEETEEAELAGDIPVMEVPEELADLSDLSPPDKTELKVEEPEEPEIDLDFAGLEDTLELDTEAEPAEPKKETVLSLDMDEDLDFELDLGGLSIHDDNK